MPPYRTIPSNEEPLIFSVLGGLCLGIIFITRPEQIVFFLSYLVVFVILVLRNRMNIARAIREALPICIIPIAISLLITTVFTLLNAFFLELPALSISNSSAFKETFSQIQSIDDGQNIDDFEFVNINRQQLKMAYQVSPTLNQVKPLIEEELARRITRLGGKDTTNTIHKGCLFPLFLRKSLTCFSFSIKLNISFKSSRSLLILPDSDRFYF